jgi:glycosyltransferase involved in cell wall biosynthesis/SAM-dependent methyltransferase
MRVAFFSPMPPSKSGIADYSAALLEPLSALADVEVFDKPPQNYDPSKFDVALYQMGNNPFHAFVYEAALEYPGVVVMHESNLHHLMADLTIRRGDWDAYLREVEYNGGPEALAFAQRVRALEIGPDYEGVKMTRRLFERAKAVIVHSRFMEREIRAGGFTGPIASIPHGAWIPEVNGMAWRRKLGLDERTPLIGIFGFLKPYKRIAQSLRAFRRLLRIEPLAKMILVGESHPDFPVHSLLQTLDISADVRVLGFTAIEDFVGYMAACDIVLNLRYPTLGESSGSLLRALGLGKSLLVSDVGSFSEFPDDICLKVPVDESEEDFIFEYLSLLVSQPAAARAMGARAREWVARECNWATVARRYLSFMQVGQVPDLPSAQVPDLPVEQVVGQVPDLPVDQLPALSDYILAWAPNPQARRYVQTHLTRLLKTLDITPPGGPHDRILEMGAYLQITPALETRLGYGEVRGCYYGPLGKTEHRRVVSADGEEFECDIDLFDAEKDCFPYPDEHFSAVLCCELIEHLAGDPMRMMAQINRILRPGGHLVLSTPNVTSMRAVDAILLGHHPGFFPAYIRPSEEGEVEARHNREYAPREIHLLMNDAGFEVVRLETGPFLEEPRPEHEWITFLLERFQLSRELRGEGIYAVGKKTGPVRDRYPAWLYT